MIELHRAIESASSNFVSFNTVYLTDRASDKHGCVTSRYMEARSLSRDFGQLTTDSVEGYLFDFPPNSLLQNTRIVAIIATRAYIPIDTRFWLMLEPCDLTEPSELFSLSLCY